MIDSNENSKMQFINDLKKWQIFLEGEWTQDERKRIHGIFQRLIQITGEPVFANLFNHQTTTFHHSHRPGKAGRTKGADIYLDDDWSDWTMAHELGHRWNNAWSRNPEQTLRASLGAGKIEWFKKGFRRFEKWLNRVFASLGIKKNIDWKALWYHPGAAPPPCGVDRNFNASEDLAESFAATIFPEDAKRRALNAAKRIVGRKIHWDWGKDFSVFHNTPRGQVLLTMIHDRLSPEQHPDQSDQRAA